MGGLKYWLWLSTRSGLGQVGQFGLLEHFGTPEAAYFADPMEYDLVAGLSKVGKEGLLDKSLTEAERILSDCEKQNQRILTIHDAAYPERLKNIYDPPTVLYLRGKDIPFDEEVAISLIGTRDPTAYGINQAQRLGHDLAKQGAVVVSGLARGLDSEGLRGALRGGGTVAAVLGCGLDVIYPRENRYLYEDVAASGCILSEYPPGTEARGSNFPARNRIISGLSLGVVVVEGGFHSGTRITARNALDQNRDMFAVPGPLDAPMSVTPNDLIRRGEAMLITSASDILVEYKDLYPRKLRLIPGLDPSTPAIAPGLSLRPKPSQNRAESGRAAVDIRSNAGLDRAEIGPKKVEETAENPPEEASKPPYVHWRELTPALTDDQRDVLLSVREKALTMEEIIEATQLPARRASSAAMVLQLSGFLNEGAGKRFSAAVRICDDEK